MLEEINDLTIGIANLIEGLLTIFFDTFLEKNEEPFLSNLVCGTNGGLQSSVELDSSLVVAFISKLAFNGCDSLLMASLRRESVKTKLAVGHLVSVVQSAPSKLREPTDFRVCPQAYAIGK